MFKITVLIPFILVASRNLGHPTSHASQAWVRGSLFPSPPTPSPRPVFPVRCRTIVQNRILPRGAQCKPGLLTTESIPTEAFVSGLFFFLRCLASLQHAEHFDYSYRSSSCWLL